MSIAARNRGGLVALAVALSWGKLWLGGCGPQGPARFAASGAVRFAGAPVQAGYIVFTPDGTKGNSGPGAQVDIKEGRYTLTAERGSIGGPHVAAIWAFDGQPITVSGQLNPNGKCLVSGHQVSIDLPRSAAELDFDVPAAAGLPPQ